ncbi:maleylpyruvate isomerase family mycothiol-dependent enzyme [Kitasatospora sp. NPDC056138]|uniref:maleylpyruvate isomerase family mycothiol-dependent enzyme n=1 Tax=Kitasatospora sp. NPDC056138 TaxID=3345724 RepID=UPI0035D5F5E3
MVTNQQQYREESASSWQRVPLHQAYGRCRENIAGLLESRPEAAGLPVPACPDWTGRDLVAHLVAVCRLVADGAVRDPADIRVMVAEGEQALREAGVAELLTEWSQLSGRIEVPAGQPVPRNVRVMTMDAFTHEADLRRALDLPVPADHPAYPDALDLLATGLSASVGAHGLPAFRLQAPHADWTIGTGEPVTTLRGSEYDLYRSLAGRRTAGQIAALDWGGTPAGPWLPAFTWGPFTPPTEATETAGAAQAG